MSPRISVLAVEGDETQRACLVASLVHQGFVTGAAATIAEAKAKLGSSLSEWGVVVLDTGLPDGEGWDLFGWMRAADVRIPVIMLTDRSEDADVVRGLDAGVSDWVTRPVSPAVLAARIRAQYRQFSETDHAVFAVGHLDFMPSRRLVVDRATGKRTKLTDKECGVIKRLLRAGGAPVEKHILLNDVWSYSEGVSTHTLETHIYRLRQKIERKAGSGPALLQTLAGGYRLHIDDGAKMSVAA